VRTGIWVFPDHPSDEIIRAASAAEETGVDTFWIGDEGVAREPFTVLTAIGLTTTRMRLGVAVTNPYLRHPVLTASTAATLAETTGRQVHLGYGPGGAASLNPLGLDRPEPVRHLRRALDLSRGVLNAEPVDGFVPGPFSRAEDRVDLWIGARGPAIMSMATRHADGFFASLSKPLVGPGLARVRSQRSVEVSLCFPVLVEKELVDRMRPYLVLSLVDAPPGTAEAAGMSTADAERAAVAVKAGDLNRAASLVPDDVVSNQAIVGTRSEAAREFAGLARQHRVAEICAAVTGDDLVAQVEQTADVLTAATRMLD